MITLKRITDTNSDEYRFTEELLTTTFPREEYRELDEQRNNTATKQQFHLMIAYKEEQAVGFISYWTLNNFCYVEHFATLHSLRGNGFGRAILEQVKQHNEKIVLEVEEPINDITTRRINFYCRSGFELCHIPYLQPPYRKGDEALPMRLMFNGCPANEDNYKKAKKIIYSNIYNCKE